MSQLTKSASFQFLINPSTLFIIAGTLASKEIIWGTGPRSKEPPTNFGLLNKNATMAGEMPSDPLFEAATNHTLFDSYNLLDPISVLEMQLISVIIQGFDNSTKWQFKFVDLPHPRKESLATYLPSNNYYTVNLPGNGQRKANVLLTDLHELVPIWAVVNLSTLKVESWTIGKEGVHDKKKALSEEDKVVAGELALADVKIQDKIDAADVGHEIFEVIPDVWDAGFVSSSPKKPSNRLVQVYFYGVYKVNSEIIAHPFNFVAHVELGSNTVRNVEELPLQVNTKEEKTTDSNILPNSSFYSEMLPPNTVRSELYRFNKGSRGADARASFNISGSEELQR